MTKKQMLSSYTFTTNHTNTIFNHTLGYTLVIYNERVWKLSYHCSCSNSTSVPLQSFGCTKHTGVPRAPIFSSDTEPMKRMLCVFRYSMALFMLLTYGNQTIQT